MHKQWFYLLLVLSTALLAAEEPKGDRVEIFATSIDSNETTLHAYDDVIVLHDDQYLSANEAIYDREKEELELIGNITVMQGADYYAIGEYAKYDLTTQAQNISPFYMTDKKSKVWMSCSEVQSKGDLLDLDGGMLSGCDPDDPLWELYFSSLDYDKETKWLNIYNARLHLYDLPIFYLPYFGYSLDTKRRTGLLIPSMGYSGSEGFYYEQPLYVAESDRWDLELRPQIRTSRGKGLYGIFRFADSPVSKGEITMGYFGEKSDYVLENDLANEEHHGFNVYYENYDFLNRWFGLELKGQSGLYVDVNWMNDVEYINLSNGANKENYATTSQVFSRINSFYNEEKNYVGAYFKYFLDLTTDNNGETLQNLPTLQYHHYIETFFDEHLMGNVNVSYNNLYRPEGKTAMKTYVDVPVTVQTAALDDYLTLSYRGDLHGRHIAFGSSEEESVAGVTYESGEYARVSHTFKAMTQLMKGYEEHAHSMAFGVSYTDDGMEHRDGYYDEIKTLCDLDSSDERCTFYSLDEVTDETDLDFIQYLFDDKGKQLLYHRLTQSIDHEAGKFSELENELEWRVTDTFSIYSDTFYDHDLASVTKQISTLRYNDGSIRITANHIFEDKERFDADDDSDYLTSSASYRYNSHYRYFASYAYDLESNEKKRAEIGFMYQKRCWDFGLRYVENNRPILRSGGNADSIYDKYVYFTVMLKPMGGTEFGYEYDNE